MFKASLFLKGLVPRAAPWIRWPQHLPCASVTFCLSPSGQHRAALGAWGGRPPGRSGTHLCQGPPVHVGAAHVDVPPIHDPEFGVQDAAGELPHGHLSHLGSWPSMQDSGSASLALSQFAALCGQVHSYLLPAAPLSGCYQHPHFTGGKTEASTCPGPSRQPGSMRIVPAASCSWLSLRPQVQAAGLSRARRPHPVLCPWERTRQAPWNRPRGKPTGRCSQPWAPGLPQAAPLLSPCARAVAGQPLPRPGGQGPMAQAPTSGRQDLQVGGLPGQCRGAGGHHQGDVPIQQLLQLLQKGLSLGEQASCEGPPLPPGGPRPLPGGHPDCPQLHQTCRPPDGTLTACSLRAGEGPGVPAVRTSR